MHQNTIFIPVGTLPDSETDPTESEPDKNWRSTKVIPSRAYNSKSFLPNRACIEQQDNQGDCSQNLETCTKVKGIVRQQKLIKSFSICIII